MVEKLCLKFGSPIAEVDGVTYHDFPLVSALKHESSEHWMRENGFGYRAKYIRASADMIMGAENNENSWLDNLLAMDYDNAKAELMKLTGIGAKVADCICLMSLGHLCAVPVDTHVHQIAVRIYTPHLSKYKTVTPAVYNEIGGFFRNLYGDKAGWAHTLMLERISSMVEKLCLKFGSPIAEVDGVTYHDFPLVSALKHESSEHWMRENGFGYRAKYIRASADMIMGAENNENSWLDNLLAMDYDNAKAELMKLTGIGA
ncbi:hypothetical protein J437_LFUL004339, partial [Ladona fulva]